jgi:hypothetical protein
MHGIFRRASNYVWWHVKRIVGVLASTLVVFVLAVGLSLMLDESFHRQPGTWNATSAPIDISGPSWSWNESGPPYADWDSEALHVIHQQAAQWSPILPANACGAGTSSCFKCHDGRRAQAPTIGKDKDIGAWHLHHQKVNNSCAGCHHGNPRIIKQEIAHIGLIPDPRKNSEVCASCHKPGDVPTVLKSYQLAKN